MKKQIVGTLVLGLVTGLSLPTAAQQGTTRNRTVQSEQGKSVQIPSGGKQKIKGVIVSRDADSFLMQDLNGGDVKVNLTSSTKVEEKKSNPFRRAKNYGTTQLLKGLTVEVEGHGDGSGAMAADKGQMTDGALAVARTVETRVTPVEGRVGDAENRLSEAEANAQRLSGQLEELSAISNAARGGAKAAQETADMAVAGVEATNNRIDTLVSSLDEYEPKQNVTVNFKAGRSILSTEAKDSLDELAAQAKNERVEML